MKRTAVTLGLLALLAPRVLAQVPPTDQTLDRPEDALRFAAPLVELQRLLGSELGSYDVRLVVGVERDHIVLAPDVVIGVRPLLLLDPRGAPAVEELERLLVEWNVPVFVQGLAWRNAPNTPRPVVVSAVYRVTPLVEDAALRRDVPDADEAPKGLTLQVLTTDSIPPHHHLHASLVVPTAGHELQVTRVERLDAGMRVDLLWVKPRDPVPPVVDTVRAFADLGTEPGSFVVVFFAVTDDPKQPPEYRQIAKLPLQ